MGIDKFTIRTNTFLAGKDDNNYCKECSKEISDVEDIKYKGLCSNCWGNLGISTNTLQTDDEIMDMIMGRNGK
ncbi:hypothetical protein ACN6MY_10935 [Peribacillus sp. B-H-3]|uniref:hypothetical protein n=1 Tax=Peribacillus sp. B-H-3 TaxID=3400420 RepID=UPI003B023CA7